MAGVGAKILKFFLYLFGLVLIIIPIAVFTVVFNPSWTTFNGFLDDIFYLIFGLPVIGLLYAIIIFIYSFKLKPYSPIVKWGRRIMILSFIGPLALIIVSFLLMRLTEAGLAALAWIVILAFLCVAGLFVGAILIAIGILNRPNSNQANELQ